MSKAAVSIQESDNAINVVKTSALCSGSSSSFLSSTRSPLVAESQSISNLTKPLVQPKLKIGAPNDKYEQEADRVADQVMRMPEPGAVQTQNSPLQIQRVCPEREEKLQRQTEEEEELIQTKPITQRQPEEKEELLQTKYLSSGEQTVTPDLGVQIDTLRGGGQPLPESTRAFFEPRFGYDFSRVRVHAGARAAEMAREVDARAFTVGRNVVFGRGEYDNKTSSGRKLLAHELTHVVQQNGENLRDQKVSYPISLSGASDGHRLIANEFTHTVRQGSERRQEAVPVIRLKSGPMIVRKESYFEKRLRETISGSIDKRPYAAAALLDVKGWKEADPSGTLSKDKSHPKAIGKATNKLVGVLRKAGFKRLPRGTMRLVTNSRLSIKAAARVAAIAKTYLWPVVVYEARSKTSIVHLATYPPPEETKQEKKKEKKRETRSWRGRLAQLKHDAPLRSVRAYKKTGEPEFHVIDQLKKGDWVRVAKEIKVEGKLESFTVGVVSTGYSGIVHRSWLVFRSIQDARKNAPPEVQEVLFPPKKKAPAETPSKAATSAGEVDLLRGVDLTKLFAAEHKVYQIDFSKIRKGLKLKKEQPFLPSLMGLLLSSGDPQMAPATGELAEIEEWVKITVNPLLEAFLTEFELVTGTVGKNIVNHLERKILAYQGRIREVATKLHSDPAVIAARENATAANQLGQEAAKLYAQQSRIRQRSRPVSGIPAIGTTPRKEDEARLKAIDTQIGKIRTRVSELTTSVEASVRSTSHIYDFISAKYKDKQDFDWKRLAATSTVDQVETVLKDDIKKRLDRIKKVRSLMDRSGGVFKLDALVARVSAALGISPGTLAHRVIENQRATVGAAADNPTVAMLELAILLVPGGAWARLTSLALSVAAAAVEARVYSKKQAAYELGLLEAEPTAAWFVLSLITAGIDAKLVIKSALWARTKQALKAGDPNALKKLAGEYDKLEELGKQRKRIADTLEDTAEFEEAVQQFKNGLISRAASMAPLDYKELVKVASLAVQRGILRLGDFILYLKQRNLYTKLSEADVKLLPQAFDEGKVASASKKPPTNKPGTRLKGADPINVTLGEPPARYSRKKISSIDDLKDDSGNIAPLETGVVYEFEGGHKVWKESDGTLRHNSVLGSSSSRQGFEKEFYTASRHGEKNLADMERAHTLGQGTGWESPFGIYYAPKQVNQTLQNNGIEGFLRKMYETLPNGQKAHIRTSTKAHWGTLRLKEIRYRIELDTGAGVPKLLFEYKINVGGARVANPKVTDAIVAIGDKARLRKIIDTIGGTNRFKDKLRPWLSATSGP